MQSFEFYLWVDKLRESHIYNYISLYNYRKQNFNK